MADSTLCKSGIYVIRNLTNGRVYVGSSNDMRRRCVAHKRQLVRGDHHCRPLQDEWASMGAEAFTFEVLEAVAQPSGLVFREQHWMDTLSAHHTQGGYNLAPLAYSCVGVKMSLEARLKISAAQKGRPLSASHKANLRAAHKNRPPISAEALARAAASRMGQKRTAEQCANISKAKLAQKLKMTDEQRQIVIAANKGRKATPAAREAMSKAHTGHIFSAETRKKISDAHKGKVLSEAHKANLRAVWAAKRKPRSQPEGIICM